MATIKQVVETVKRCAPTCVGEALLVCELPLKCVGWGQFRAVFHILGSPLVIKIPFGDPSGDSDDSLIDANIVHAQDEYTSVQRILQSRRAAYQPLKQYMPHFYYFNLYSGVSIVHKYKLLPRCKGLAARVEMNSQFSKVVKAKVHDDLDIVNNGNVGVDRWGRLKLLDLGCINIEAS